MEVKDKRAKRTSFSRAIIAGLICGIIAAVLDAVYDYYYRRGTGFESSTLISPFSIFVAFPLLLIVAGFIFFEMVEFMARGKMLFTLLFFVIMVLAVIYDVSQSSRPLSGVNGLLAGMEIITGLIICFLLPFLATHPKIFMENEELSESGMQ